MPNLLFLSLRCEDSLGQPPGLKWHKENAKLPLSPQPKLDYINQTAS